MSLEGQVQPEIIYHSWPRESEGGAAGLGWTDTESASEQNTAFYEARKPARKTPDRRDERHRVPVDGVLYSRGLRAQPSTLNDNCSDSMSHQPSQGGSDNMPGPISSSFL